MKISVALCTFNGSLFLEKQFDSILNQTVSVNEIVIFDDGSFDKTVEIIDRYQKKYSGLIQFYQNNPSLGTIENFEKAISYTTGDLIFLSDQDDIWYPEKVQKSSQYFKDNDKCILLFSNGDLIDDEDKVIGATLWDKWGFDDQMKSVWKNNKKAFSYLVKGDNKITGATVCFKKSLKAKISPITLPLNYWHDGWLGTNAAALKGLFFIDESLIQYRVHTNQQVGISNKGLDTVTLNANKNYITKNEYFNRLAKMYPHLKKHLPNQKGKSNFEKFLLKVKRCFNL
jgi:glycosyltransferase involved in cell wall biosynthesis